MSESVDNLIFDLFNYALKVFEPTKADLERVITKEEQIELSLKQKCRVDIWKWNPVYEYRLAFEEKGRYQKWNDKNKLKMLAKSVNMMMSHEFISDEDIVKMRKKEWEIQKKDSILSLNLWAHERSKKETLLQRTNEAQTQSNFSDNISDLLELLVDDIDEPEPQERNEDDTSDILELLYDEPEPQERNEDDMSEILELLYDEPEPQERNEDDMSEILELLVDDIDDEPEPQERNEDDTSDILELLYDEPEPQERNEDDMSEILELLYDEPEPQERNEDDMSEILELLVDDIDDEPRFIDYNDNISQTFFNTENALLEQPVNNPCEKEIDTILNLIDPDTDNANTVTAQNYETEYEPQGKQRATVPNGCFHINLDVSIPPGQSHDTDALLENLLNVNTESMSIDTQLLTQSQLAHLSEENQQLSPGEPPNYKRFNNEVPLNSTHAQSFCLT